MVVTNLKSLTYCFFKMNSNILYKGLVKRHFLIGFKNIILTIITLGIYRFWGKTNLRSYICSHLEIFGQPLVYHGTPFELLKAFLRVLPVFILIIAMQKGLELISIFLGTALTVVGLIWIFEYAFYSKHQYLYSRTSWQGICFRLEGSRVKYANLSFIIFIKSLLTLGLRDHVYVIMKNKFISDNTFWGDIALEFTGDANDLKKMNYKTWFLMIPTCFLSRIYFSFYCSRYVLNHLAFSGVKFRVNYTFLQFFRFFLWNLLLMIFTFGMASPYITYRHLKFIQKYYNLEGDGKSLEAHQIARETTGQDGASSLLDLSDF